MTDTKILKDIEEYGWTIMAIEASDYLPSFAYTTGLWKNYQHPEIIAFGLPVQTLHIILNEAGDMVKAAKPIRLNKLYNDFFENGNVEFLSVHSSNIGDYFGAAIQFYGTETFPALQLSWTDRKNKFPWDEGFEEEFIHKQPMLDRNMAFKFFEEKNLAVYTTKQFLEGKPVTFVSHDSDGDWQFLTEERASMADMQMVSLEQMVLSDPSLNDIFDLDYGQEAERKAIGEKWNRRLSG